MSGSREPTRCALLGLPAVWENVLTGAGCPVDHAQAQIWFRRLVIEMPPTHLLRHLAARPVRIPRGPTGVEVRRAAISLVGQLPVETVAAWVVGVDEGVPLLELARQAGVGRRVVELTALGPSWPAVDADQLAEQVRDGWLEGASREQIAALIGVAPGSLKSALSRRGLTLQKRLSLRAAAASLGISTVAASRILPRPDGVDGAWGWWWPDTVEAAASDLPTCSVCGARVDHSRGRLPRGHKPIASQTG